MAQSAHGAHWSLPFNWRFQPLTQLSILITHFMFIYLSNVYNENTYNFVCQSLCAQCINQPVNSR